MGARAPAGKSSASLARRFRSLLRRWRLFRDRLETTTADDGRTVRLRGVRRLAAHWMMPDSQVSGHYGSIRIGHVHIFEDGADFAAAAREALALIERTDPGGWSSAKSAS